MSVIERECCGEYCGGTAQFIFMQDDQNELKFCLPLSEFALALDLYWESPNPNPLCCCCARAALMLALRKLLEGWSRMQLRDQLRDQ